MERTDLRTRRTPARLAFADHMDRFVIGQGAPRTPERAEMLTRLDPTLDRPVQPGNRGRVSGVLVGVDDTRRLLDPLKRR